jgi:hypothetical protein
LKLHNRFIDDIRRTGINGRSIPETGLFDEARRSANGTINGLWSTTICRASSVRRWSTGS